LQGKKIRVSVTTKAYYLWLQVDLQSGDRGGGQANEGGPPKNAGSAAKHPGADVTKTGLSFMNSAV